MSQVTHQILGELLAMSSLLDGHPATAAQDVKSRLDALYAKLVVDPSPAGLDALEQAAGTPAAADPARPPEGSSQAEPKAGAPATFEEVLGQSPDLAELLGSGAAIVSVLVPWLSRMQLFRHRVKDAQAVAKLGAELFVMRGGTDRDIEPSLAQAQAFMAAAHGMIARMLAETSTEAPESPEPAPTSPELAPSPATPEASSPVQ